MLIVKGVNVYPAAIKGIVGEFMPDTTGALRIILDSPGPLVRPPLKLRVEYGSEGMGEEKRHDLELRLSKKMTEALRVNPSIELVPPFTLPRVSGKVSLIEIKEP